MIFSKHNFFYSKLIKKQNKKTVKYPFVRVVIFRFVEFSTKSIDYNLFVTVFLTENFSKYFQYPYLFRGATIDPEKVKKLEEAFEFLEIFLTDNDYVAGNVLTVADISIVTSVTTARVSSRFSTNKKKKEKYLFYIIERSRLGLI